MEWEVYGLREGIDLTGKEESAAEEMERLIVNVVESGGEED